VVRSVYMMAAEELSSEPCPEADNSTDCLLRYLIAVLEEKKRSDDAEFNWDPIASPLLSLSP
jgi:hypothetical protein